MEKTVKGKKKGQAPIPAEIREQLGIKTDDDLIVKVVDQTVVFKRLPKLLNLAGIFAGHADVGELKKEINKMREEY